MRTVVWHGLGDMRLEAVRTVLSAVDGAVVRDEEPRLVPEEAGVERDTTVTADFPVRRLEVHVVSVPREREDVRHASA
ncbi:hypothetical protein [Streptomyces sp. Tu 3180]|uniref:hypothetical protein n=1 Tax=Streptomyces sp. Tu 3180 TaxID=2682611 RepID=UPI001357CEE2|nr:hypothetical protein [Streptomyces sp. Tu 3180]KAF3463953.1 hypothetical protein GL259_06325 [Streptomyces sp. Tu 3180]